MSAERQRKTQLDQVSFFFLLFIIIFAASARVLGGGLDSFPLNDGGLFYSMVKDIQAGNFRLPVTTSYNGGGLPFAYPPLGFYIAAFFSDIFHWDLLSLMRWLPVIVNSLSLFGFYFLAFEILNDQKQAVLAVFVLAFIPRSFAWLVMGGGITRAWGYLFALLTFWSLYSFFAAPTIRNMIFSSFLAALVLLTHPEAAFYTFLSASFFLVFFRPGWRVFLKLLLIGAGSLILASPWWVTIFTRHGWKAFFSAFLSSQENTADFLRRILFFFQFNFTDEPILTLFAVLGLLGIFTLLAKKHIFLPLWIFTLFLVEPRSASLYAASLLAMPTAVLLDEIIFQGFKKISVYTPAFPSPANWAEEMLNSKISLIFFAFIFLYGVYASYTTIWNIRAGWSLRSQDINAFYWVKEDTAEESRFLLLTSAKAMLDPVSEWFPAITERVSLASVFGFEWVPDGRFGERISDYVKLQKCFDYGVQCLEDWADENDETYTHVYLARKTDSPLGQALQESPSYDLIYEFEDIQIFEKRNTK